MSTLVNSYTFFKECNVCGRVWISRDSYLNDTIKIADITDQGLALRNCICGTTHGLYPEFLWPDKALYFKSLWNKDPKYRLVNWLRKRIEGKDNAIQN